MIIWEKSLVMFVDTVIVGKARAFHIYPRFLQENSKSFLKGYNLHGKFDDQKAGVCVEHGTSSRLMVKGKV